VTIDAQRRRVYAAHTASQRLLIADADTGKVLGQVKVGPLHGVAVDPTTGYVYTGDGTDQTVDEVDPVTQQVLRSAAVPGNVDAIAYDRAMHRVYADEDNGTHVFVVDTKTMKLVASVLLPGNDPEFLTVDPKTHALYQNISDLSEYVVVDGTTLKVTSSVPTPQIKANHPLQYDPAYRQVVIGGENGLLAAYDSTGKLVGTLAIQPRVDQCALDPGTHLEACAGSGFVTLVRDNPGAAPTLVAQGGVSNGAHTVGIDAKTGNVWIVWSDPSGDYVQALKRAP